MGKEIGKIIKINDGEMTVQLSRGEHCNVCAAKSMCSFLGPDSAYRLIKIPFNRATKEGSWVTLEYKESSRILSAMVIFLMPILFLLAGYFIGNEFFNFVYRGIVGAIMGFGFSGLTLFMLNHLLSNSRLFIPKVIDIINPGISTDYQWDS